MYGFLVVPFCITFVLSVLLVILLPWFSKKFLSKQCRISFFGSTLMALAAFIPSCIGIMSIVDPFRYGMFTYKSPEEIGDRRIRRWMPPKATDIVVHKTSYNHLAQFTVAQEAFLNWLPQICNQYPFCKQNTDPWKTGDHRLSVDEFNKVFKEVGWHFPEDSVMYGMTLSSNGAGFTIWYSEALHTAYLEAGYW